MARGKTGKGRQPAAAEGQMAVLIGWLGTVEGREEVGSVAIQNKAVPGLGNRKCQVLT